HDAGPGARSDRSRQQSLVEQADGHHVDQRVALVRRIEHELATDGRHTHAIAVTADAAHDAVHQVAGPRIRRVAETKGIEHGYRPGAHREDVSQDAAHPRCRALVRLDGRGMIVRFDLESYRGPVADRDHARVLAGPG